jgi:hypothetical protein
MHTANASLSSSNSLFTSSHNRLSEISRSVGLFPDKNTLPTIGNSTKIPKSLLTLIHSAMQHDTKTGNNSTIIGLPGAL